MQNNHKPSDIIIIGGGIIGTMINYELSKYQYKTIQFEKNPYLSDETSSGNSGIIHGGFDAPTYKIEAPLNVEGNKLWQKELLGHIPFPFKKIDSLVIAFSQEELPHLAQLYQRGLDNGLDPNDLGILSRSELLEREPNLNPNALKALLCKSSFLIDPVVATRSLATVAIQNGSKVIKSAEVTNITKQGDIFTVTINNKEQYQSYNIINAAGHFAEDISKMVGYHDYQLTTRRGEYLILAKTEFSKVHQLCFKIPTIHGKGVLVAPLISHRVMVGPTAQEGVNKNDTRLVTPQMLEKITTIGHDFIPKLDLSKVEFRFAGSRSIDIKSDDFIIRPAQKDDHFIHVAGIQSPGITSAPAIAKLVVKLLVQNGTIAERKKYFETKITTIW